MTRNANLKRNFEDEEEDFDEGSEEETGTGESKEAESKPAAERPDKKSLYGDGDEFYSVGAYGKKKAKLAELASLACSNSELVGKRIEEYA